MPKGIISNFYDQLRESIGNKPVGLINLLQTRPEIRFELKEPDRVPYARSIIQWHTWGHAFSGSSSLQGAGHLVGWHYANDRYCSCEIYRPEFASFGNCEVIRDWECDIQDVEGLSSSKSELDQFQDLDAMVQTNSPEMLTDISPAGLQKNLAHREIRIIHSPIDDDFFAQYEWDNRTFLMNSGGSHHFSAARFIASQINVDVPLTGTLRRYAINPLAVSTLKRDFDMYVISSATEISNDFHEAMTNFKAPYIRCPLPTPHEQDGDVIFLPRDNERARLVSDAMKDAGIINLGDHLTHLCAKQVLFPPPKMPARLAC